MLHSRVKLVLKYVQAVQNGELKGNHEVLRAACSLGHRLPVLNNPKFKADFYNVSLRYCFQRKKKKQFIRIFNTLYYLYF